MCFGYVCSCFVGHGVLWLPMLWVFVWLLFLLSNATLWQSTRSPFPTLRDTKRAYCLDVPVRQAVSSNPDMTWAVAWHNRHIPKSLNQLTSTVLAGFRCIMFIHVLFLCFFIFMFHLLKYFQLDIFAPKLRIILKVITMPVVMIVWSLLRDSEYVCVKPPEPSKKPILNFVSATWREMCCPIGSLHEPIWLWDKSCLILFDVRTNSSKAVAYLAIVPSTNDGVWVVPWCV